MKLSDLVKATFQKTLTGSFWKAQFGGISGPATVGKTKAEAVDNLIKELVAREENGDSLTVRWSPDGSFWVFRYTTCWEYAHYYPGKTVSGGLTVLSTATGRGEAMRSFEAHVNQYNADCAPQKAANG